MFLLNTCLCVDLILMLKYPFASKEKRMVLYMLFSIVGAAVPSLSLLFTAERRGESNTYQPSSWALGLCVTIIVGYIVIAVASVIFAAKKLRRPGISKESQKLVLIRHVLAIIGFLTAQLYILTVFVYYIG